MEFADFSHGEWTLPTNASTIPDAIFDCLIGVMQGRVQFNEMTEAIKAYRAPIPSYVLHAINKLESNLVSKQDEKISLMIFAGNLAQECDDDSQKAQLLEEELQFAIDLRQYKDAYDILGALVIIYSKLNNQSMARKCLAKRETLKAKHLTQFPLNPRSHPRRGSCRYFRKSDGLCGKVGYSLVCPFNARVSECPMGKSRRRKRDVLTKRFVNLGKEAVKGYVIDVMKWIIGIGVLLLLAFISGFLSLIYGWILSLIT